MNTMKQTELGEIPEDWKVCNIGKETNLKARIGWQSLRTQEYLRTGQFALVTGTDFNSGLVDWNTCCFVSEWRYKQDNNIQLKKDDVLITKDGTIGKVGYIENLPFPATLNSGIYVIRPKQDNKIIPRFLFYTFLSEYFDHFINTISAGSTITHLYQKDFVNFDFPLPPPKEQTAIATVLSDTDELINSLEKLLQKKQAIKTATIQQLLTGKTRLPKFSCFSDGTPKGYLKTELGEIPEDWEVVELGKISTVKGGGTPSTLQPSFWNGEINWCTPTDITTLSRKYLCKTNKTISKLGLDNSAADLLPIGSILMTTRATIGECAIAMQPMTTNQGFKNFICNDNLNNEFLYYLLGTQKSKFIALCNGSTFLELSTKQVRSFKIAIPKSPKEQTAIATILSDMDTEIRSLSDRLQKVRLLKRGLMQRLLSGKIRLPY